MPIAKKSSNKLLHYQKEGKGKCILWLHGFMETSQMWNSFQESFVDEYLCIAPDLPGHGRSSEFGEVHTMKNLAEKVKEILDFEKIEKVVVIGHSMGGYVALELARLYPELISGLCLFHSHALADNPQTKVNRERTIEIIKKGKSKFIATFIPDLFAKENVAANEEIITDLIAKANLISDEDIIATLIAMKNRLSGLDVLENANFPVSFIIGKKDVRANLQELSEQMLLPKECHSLILGEIGHMGPFEAFSKTSKFIKSFIDQIETA